MKMIHRKYGTEMPTDMGLSYPHFYAFSKELQPKPLDWDEHLTIGGSLMWKKSSDELSPELEEFLQAGNPPVYFGFGSMPVTKSDKFKKLVHDLIEACPEERFVLFLGSTSHEADKQNGDDFLGTTLDQHKVFIIRSAPHHLLFPRCKCIIHHCGAGTTAAAVASGKPSIACSVFADQPYWASRLVKIGISPGKFSFASITAPQLANAIKACENEEIIARAREIGAKVNEENGLQNAAEWVLNQWPSIAE